MTTAKTGSRPQKWLISWMKAHENLGLSTKVSIPWTKEFKIGYCPQNGRFRG